MSRLAGNKSIVRRYVPVPGGQMHLRESASLADHLVPLVMLHPTASSSLMFEGIMGMLDGRYRVLAVDTPGFGESDPLEGEVTVAGLASAIAEALASMGVERCSLYGNHTGAVLAAWIAANQPAMVDRLMLSGPPFLSEERRAQMAESVTPLVLTDDGSHLVALWQRYRAFSVTAGLDVPHRELALNLVATAPVETFHAVINEDLETLYRGISCPTVITAGEGDTLRAGFAEMVEMIPDCRLELIPDAGNFVVDEAPDAVVRQVRSWFE